MAKKSNATKVAKAFDDKGIAAEAHMTASKGKARKVDMAKIAKALGAADVKDKAAMSALITPPQAMSPEAVSEVTKSRAKAVKAAKGAVAAKVAATIKDAIDAKLITKGEAKVAPIALIKGAVDKAFPAPKAPKPLDPKVVELIALLKLKKGATNDEAAEALKIKSKGKAAHQSPSAQVRAMIRDKVRKLHDVESTREEGRGNVQRIVKP